MDNTFQIGSQYLMRFISDYDTTDTYKCVNRTAKTVTLKNRAETITCKVHKDTEGNDYAFPLGRYSMCPILNSKNILK
jgi:hypothetical protein